MRALFLGSLAAVMLSASVWASDPAPTGNIVPWPADYVAGYQQCCVNGCVTKLSRVIRPEPLQALCRDVCQCSQKKLQPLVIAETLTRQALQKSMTPQEDKALDLCVFENLRGKDLNAMRLPAPSP